MAPSDTMIVVLVGAVVAFALLVWAIVRCCPRNERRRCPRHGTIARFGDLPTPYLSEFALTELS